MMHFCGPCSGPAFRSATINACLYEPTAAAIVLALAVLQAVWQVRRLRLLERLHYQRPDERSSSEHHCRATDLGLLVVTLVYEHLHSAADGQSAAGGRLAAGHAARHIATVSYTSLAASHLVAFVYDLVVDGGPPFAAVSDAALVSAWAVLLVSAAESLRNMYLICCCTMHTTTCCDESTLLHVR